MKLRWIRKCVFSNSILCVNRSQITTWIACLYGIFPWCWPPVGKTWWTSPMGGCSTDDTTGAAETWPFMIAVGQDVSQSEWLSFRWNWRRKVELSCPSSSRLLHFGSRYSGLQENCRWYPCPSLSPPRSSPFIWRLVGQTRAFAWISSPNSTLSISGLMTMSGLSSNFEKWFYVPSAWSQFANWAFPLNSLAIAFADLVCLCRQMTFVSAPSIGVIETDSQQIKPDLQFFLQAGRPCNGKSTWNVWLHIALWWR